MALTRYAKLLQDAGIELPQTMTATGLKAAGISPRDFIQEADATLAKTGQVQPGELVTQFEELFDANKSKKDATKQAGALKKLLGQEKKSRAAEGNDGSAVASDGGDMVNATDMSGVTDTTDIGELPVESDVDIASLTPEALQNLIDSGTADQAIDDYLADLAARSQRALLGGDLNSQFIVSKEQSNLPPALKQRMVQLGEAANQGTDTVPADSPVVADESTVADSQQTEDASVVDEDDNFDISPEKAATLTAAHRNSEVGMRRPEDVERNSYGETAYEAFRRIFPDREDQFLTMFDEGGMYETPFIANNPDLNQAIKDNYQKMSFEELDAELREAFEDLENSANSPEYNYSLLGFSEDVSPPQSGTASTQTQSDMPAIPEQRPDLTEGDFKETGGDGELSQALADAVAEEGNQNIDAEDNLLGGLSGETTTTTTTTPAGGGNMPSTPPPAQLSGTGGTPASGGNPNATASGQGVKGKSASSSQTAQSTQAAPQTGSFAFSTNQMGGVQATPSIQQLINNLSGGTPTPAAAAATPTPAAPTPAAATASPGMSNAQTASLQNLFGVPPTTPVQGTSAAQIANLQKVFGVNPSNQKSSGGGGSGPGSPPPPPDPTDPPMKDFDPSVNYPFTTGSIERQAKRQGVDYDPIEQVPEDTKTEKRLPKVPEGVNMGGRGLFTRPADAAYRQRVPISVFGGAAGGTALIRALQGGGEEQVPEERMINAGDFEQRLDESAQRFSDKFYDIMH